MAKIIIFRVMHFMLARMKLIVVTTLPFTWMISFLKNMMNFLVVI